MGHDQEQLLESLPWARQFARSCAARLPGHLDHDDLQSAGVLGYLLAAPRYNATLGATFRGFCAVRIRGAVLDELRRWDWAPRSVHKKYQRITRVTSNLIERLEREPTGSELASALGVQETELAAYQTLAMPRQIVSLDEMGENDQGGESIPLTEKLADPTVPSPDVAVLSAEDRRTMLQCLHALPKSQAIVIILYYLENIPLRQVARTLSVTPSRVSQLHHQALDRLKKAWERTNGSREPKSTHFGQWTA